MALAVFLGIVILVWLIFDPPIPSWIPWAAALAAVAASVVEIAVVVPSAAVNTRVLINKDLLSIHRGRFVSTIDDIPLRRITVVRQSVSPVDRRFGHAQVTVTSTTREITLPPLAHDDAEQLRTFIDRNAALDPDDAPEK
jgi:membrane protein YdbS with pleckstrin-like domain